MVAANGTEGEGWGKSLGDAQPELSHAGGGPQRGPQASLPVLPPFPMPFHGTHPGWLPVVTSNLAACAELAHMGLVRSVGDSSPQMSGRGQDVCLRLLFISVQT